MITIAAIHSFHTVSTQPLTTSTTFRLPASTTDPYLGKTTTALWIRPGGATATTMAAANPFARSTAFEESLLAAREQTVSRSFQLLRYW